MMIVTDSHIHLWEKGTPPPFHQQEPYEASQALRDMDKAGIHRAVLHPPFWDSDGNEVAFAAARAHPDRFAVMGWVPPEDPRSAKTLLSWSGRTELLGLRFTFIVIRHGIRTPHLG